MNRPFRILTLLAGAMMLMACTSAAPGELSTTAPVPPGVVPEPIPTPAEIDDCRLLMGLVPVPAGDDWPGSTSFALEFELLTKHPDAIAFVDVGQDVTTIYPSAERSDVDVPQLISDTLDQLAARGFNPEIEWLLGDELAWTFDELCSAFSLIGDQMGTAVGVESIAPNRSGQLEVGVADPASLELDILLQLQRQHPGMIVVTVQTGTVEPASHRANDTDGFNAGIAIQTYTAGDWLSCSAAFKIQNSHGAFLLTAAHCSSANVQTVRNGTSLCWAGLSGNAFIGHTGSRILNSNGDFAVIQGAPATTGRVWLGARCTGDREVGVIGSVASSAGARVGFSGHNSGQTTGTVVSSRTGCVDVTYDLPISQTIRVCNRDSADPYPSSSLVVGGDSGGPVMAYTSTSSVYGAGVIVARNRTTRVAFYMSLPVVLYLYSASVVPG